MTTIIYTATQGAVVDGVAVGTWLGEDSTTDLSANLNDLTENGTLVQSPTVIYGPTIQYSDFSATNYLERVYDADFDLLGDPATPGHMIMAWVNISSVTSNDTIVDRQDTGGAGARYNLRIEATGEISCTVSDGTNTRVCNSATDLNNTGWNHITATWDGVGNQAIYINGVLDVLDTFGTAVGSLVNGTAVFRVGLSATGVDSCDHGISLVKLYPFVGSATSIALVYNLENDMYISGGQYTTVGQGAVVTFSSTELTRNSDAIRSVKTSIGGTQQVLFDREEITWNVTTSELTEAAVIDMRVMLTNLVEGGVFNFDPYETRVISASLQSNKYSANRIGTSDYFTYSFVVREE